MLVKSDVRHLRIGGYDSRMLMPSNISLRKQPYGKDVRPVCPSVKAQISRNSLIIGQAGCSLR